MNNNLLPLQLIDFVLREEDYVNKKGVLVSSQHPLMLGCSITVVAGGDYDLYLHTEEVDLDSFISSFGLTSVNDLETISQDDIWEVYRKGEAMLSCSMLGESDVEMRVTDGIESLAGAKAYIAENYL